MSKKIDKLVEAGKIVTVGQVLDREDGAEPSTPNPPKAPVPPAADYPTPSAAGTDRLTERLKMLLPPAFADSIAELLQEDRQADALQRMRESVPPHYISFLPKQNKQQREDMDKDPRRHGIRCGLCHGWHHRDAPHVPYVGHAAVTDRLLDVDPHWSWEPVAWTPEGLPRFDASGGMWIRLTVGGMTRLGYGHGAQKANQDPGAREKEVIGDALRNAAMRFGVALDLWHKGELHPDGEGATDEVAEDTPDPTEGAPEGTFITDEQRDRILTLAASARVDARTICDRYGIEALPQLHADTFEQVIDDLKMTISKRTAKVEQPLGLDDDVSY